MFIKKNSIDLSKFSETQIAELKQAFLLFDKDGNGDITIQGFFQVFSWLKVKINKQIFHIEIGAVFRSLGLFPTVKI